MEATLIAVVVVIVIFVIAWLVISAMEFPPKLRWVLYALVGLFCILILMRHV